MIDRTQRNTAKLQAYRGVLTEKGVLAADEMRSELLFKRPNQFRSRVLAPESYAGVMLVYNGRQLIVYYPKVNYGILFDNLTPPTPSDEQTFIADTYRHNVATYNYDMGDAGKVAGLPTLTLDYKAKRRGAIHPSGSVQVYDKYSLPLASTLRFANGAQYSNRFDEITLNPVLDDELFASPLPKNAIVSRWDISSPGIPESEMRQQANFDYKLPSHLPAGFTLEKIVRQESPVPAFTVVYRHGTQFIYLSIFRDTGLRPVSEEHGIPVASGRLLVSPTLSSYTVTQRGTMYIFTTNLPFDQMLSTAEDLSS
jgi:outer membrane lipoprotein-sorting protein